MEKENIVFPVVSPDQRQPEALIAEVPKLYLFLC